MNNPWTTNEGAYDPMFCDALSVGGAVLRTCMMIDGTADPLSEGAVDTRREDVVFVVRPADSQYAAQLKRGDTAYCGADTYRVSEVTRDFALGTIVKARQN